MATRLAISSAATSIIQSRIVWGDAAAMVKKSPQLSENLKIVTNNIYHEESYSSFSPTSSDAHNLDGKNTHICLIDELHAHKTRDVWDVMETSTGSRTNSLIMAITTAGTDKEGICYEVRGYGKKVLDGIIEDDSFFCIIYTLDPEDDPFNDDSVWIKANPGLGVCKSWDDLRRLAKKAQETPTARANYLTKHMNIWCDSSEAFLDVQKWRECPEFKLTERFPVYLGLDFAEKSDLMAACKIHMLGENRIGLEYKFWLPEGRLAHCSERQRSLYKHWAELGELTLVDGEVIDAEEIREELVQWLKGDDLLEIAYDPWSATQFAIRMAEDGYPMVEVSQSTRNLSEALRQIEVMNLGKLIEHDHNSCMTWQISNLRVKRNMNDDLRPFKEHKESKIDGCSAMLTAMSRVIVSGGLDVYDPLKDDDLEGYLYE